MEVEVEMAMFEQALSLLTRVPVVAAERTFRIRRGLCRSLQRSEEPLQSEHMLKQAAMQWTHGRRGPRVEKQLDNGDNLGQRPG